MRFKEDADEYWSFNRILEALAVNDQEFIARVYARSSYPKTRSPYYPYQSLIANAIRDGLKGGLKALQETVKDRPRKAPLDIEVGIWDSLCGIANNKPDLFTKGVSAEAKRDKTRDDEYRQYLRAAGLLHLANMLNPSILEGFKWKSLAPWYRDLYQWSQNNTPDLTTVDLRSVSVDLHNVWIELENPYWTTVRIKSAMPKKNQPSMFGLSAEHWKTIHESSPNLLLQANQETEYQKALCSHYKLPICESKYFGQLMPNMTALAVEIAEREECRKFAAARRFESKNDYYIVNYHGHYLVVYCATLGCLGQEHLDSFKTADEARSTAEQKIKWLMQKGFKEVPMATPEFILAEELSKKNKPIPIGFSEVDAKQFDKDFEKHWNAKMKAREKQKETRPKARLKAKLKADAPPLEKKRGTTKQPAATRTTTVSAKKVSTPNVAAKKTSTKKSKATPTQTNKGSKSGSTSKSTSKFRRFEFTEGSSSKFWEIARKGSEVTTKWGRIGTDGQNKTKSFGDESKAQAEYDKLVREKTGKGYEEV